MVISRCTEPEVQVLRQVARESFAETFSHANTAENMRQYLDESFSAARLTRELGDPQIRYYLLREEGVPAGYLKLNEGTAQTEPMGGDAMEIERIYVLRAFQGRGFGRRLLEHGLRTARELGRAYIWLGVWAHNTNALAFYRHLGFVKAGEHAFVLGGERQTDYVMRLDLK